MVRRRKTAAERRQESYEADRRAWELFYPRLTAVQSLNDAIALMGEVVPPDTPGRRFYSNLGFFLQTFSAPAGASLAELTEYARLINLFDAEGALRAGARAEVDQRLQDEMARRLL
jgi:hypothetical protein